MYKDIPELTKDQLTKFWSYIDKENYLPCWIWLRDVDKNGYGYFYINPLKYRCTRIIYSIYYPEEDITNSLILHECDNPPCCDPYHLFTGTNQDNSDDCVKKNRKPNQRGELNPNYKLSDININEIRTKFKLGQTIKELAIIYKVSYTHIYNIIHKKRR